MKKTILATALTAAFMPLAHAQSSVTLYGLIDEGVAYTSNQRTAPGEGHSAFQAVSSQNSNDRWGLKGNEDLGGGLSAIFDLENGFDLNNGKLSQSGDIFNRQAWVGLSSHQFGSLTIGRQTDSVVDYLSPLSMAGEQYGGNQFAHPFDNDNLGDSFQISNAVKYTSVPYSGLTFGGLYGFSNQAGAFADNRAYSLGASYANGPLSVAAAYMEIDNPGVNGTGALDGGSGGDSSFTAGLQRVWGAGVNYTYGPATGGFVFTQSHLDNVSSVNNTGTTADDFGAPSDLRFNNFEVNGRYHLTPALSLAASYTYTDGSLDGFSPKWHQVNVQTDYALSKRTDVYLQAAYQRQLDAGGTAIAGAGINGVPQSASGKQVVVTTGLRTTF